MDVLVALANVVTKSGEVVVVRKGDRLPGDVDADEVARLVGLGVVVDPPKKPKG
ncbi:hypothetical protein [Stomatohabitans albus]|uniref:hypothetical protein n=1 Tax=Stomatohabitans albus TaxID=3110766 RepID=UPI00300D4FD2